MRPLTGKPDAGKLPVRFGGRGKVNPLFLPLSLKTYYARGLLSSATPWLTFQKLICAAWLRDGWMLQVAGRVR
jgi:hypothetical protein